MSKIWSVGQRPMEPYHLVCSDTWYQSGPVHCMWCTSDQPLMVHGEGRAGLVCTADSVQGRSQHTLALLRTAPGCMLHSAGPRHMMMATLGASVRDMLPAALQAGLDVQCWQRHNAAALWAGLGHTLSMAPMLNWPCTLDSALRACLWAQSGLKTSPILLIWSVRHDNFDIPAIV